MKKIIFLIAILFLSFICQSNAQAIVASLIKKKITGTIVMKDGTKLTGEFRTPGVKSKTIKYFGSGEEKKEIPSASIKMLMIPNKNNGYSKLVYSSIGSYKLSFKSKKGVALKESKNKFWLLEYEPGKKVNLYILGNRYKQKNDGNIYAYADGTRQQPGELYYYAQMKGRDSYPIILDTSGPGNALFKSYGSLFFKGKDNALSEKIKNKEKGYKSKNMLQVLREYNK